MPLCKVVNIVESTSCSLRGLNITENVIESQRRDVARAVESKCTVDRMAAEHDAECMCTIHTIFVPVVIGEHTAAAAPKQTAETRSCMNYLAKPHGC